MIGLMTLGTMLLVPCSMIALFGCMLPCPILRVPRSAVTLIAELVIIIGLTMLHGAIWFAWLAPILTCSSPAPILLGGHPNVTVYCGVCDAVFRIRR